jgi:hypothetical protein
MRKRERDGIRIDSSQFTQTLACHLLDGTVILWSTQLDKLPDQAIDQALLCLGALRRYCVCVCVCVRVCA